MKTVALPPSTRPIVPFPRPWEESIDVLKNVRITLVIASLSGGGAERVMSVMANFWAEQGRDVMIVTIGSSFDDWYRLHPRVKREALSLFSNSKHIGQAIQQNVRRIIRLRTTLRRLRPTIVISFLDTTNVLTLLASVGLNIPVIVSERNDPRMHSIGTIWNALRRLLYCHADAIVVQSNTVAEWAKGILRKQKVYIIPNPVRLEQSESVQSLKDSISDHTIYAMGRLVQQKGFDLLLEAFSQCATKHLDWSLVVLGEGEERRNLEALATKLGIDGRVHFMGAVPNPTSILKNGDLFVLSSRHEGFPNALLEAMACGLPVIATNCLSGPGEIVRNNIDGLLVPAFDVDALATAMDRLITNESERRRLGSRALEVIERFSAAKVMSMWDKVIDETWSVLSR